MLREEDTVFERCPHDREHPYAMISRDLIRDQSISPNCRWLLIYLLSNKEGWRINLQQIRSHCKGFFGRDKVYKIVNEAIEAGYLSRRKKLKEGNLLVYSYHVSETPKFKKCFQFPENQDTENTDTKERASLKKENTPNLSLPPEPKVPKAPPKEDAASADASSLADFLFSEIVKRKPDFTKKVSPTWRKDASKLLQVRSMDQIRSVIVWSLDNAFWWSKITSMTKLRTHIDTLEMQISKPYAPQQNGGSILKENQNLLKEVASKVAESSVVSCGSDYIEFNHGMASKTILTSDKDFREKVFQLLEKSGLMSNGEWKT